MAKKATLNKKAPPEEEVINVGPCSPEQERAFTLAQEVDFLIIGGSRGGGKSEVSAQISLMFKDDPKYRGMYVRTQYDQLLGSGGLWEIAGKYYPLFGATPYRSMPPYYKFPSGAICQFKQVADAATAEKHRGLQYSAIFADEITQLSKEAIIALMACLRSEAAMNSFLLGTCNPHRDNWVFDLVQWYLNDKGYVDPNKNGKVRYFVTKDNNFIFADEEDWFLENMPETVTGYNPQTEEEFYIPPKKFAFLQLTIFSNKILLKNNPRYLSELQNLPEHEREKQLYGNWYASIDEVSYWDRKWVRGVNGERVVDKVPAGARRVRAWDKANTEFTAKNNTDADFTASIGLAKSKEGFFYIYGDFHESNYDEYAQVYGKFRKRSGERNLLMLQQARYDGNDTQIVIAQDAGADGKQVFQDLVRDFSTEGFSVKGSPMPVQTKKLIRFEPFASACQAGLVYIVENTFPDQKTLDAFYKELESFSPDPITGKWRSSRIVKDDWVDCVADAYNFLCKEKVYAPACIPVVNAPSIKSQYNL